MTPIRKWVSGVTFALVILLTPLFSKAFQSDSTHTPPSNPPPQNPLPPGSSYAPVDTGIVFLLIAGLGLGVITVVAKRKNQAAKKEL